MKKFVAVLIFLTLFCASVFAFTLTVVVYDVTTLLPFQKEAGGAFRASLPPGLRLMSLRVAYFWRICEMPYSATASAA